MGCAGAEFLLGECPQNTPTLTLLSPSRGAAVSRPSRVTPFSVKDERLTSSPSKSSPCSPPQTHKGFTVTGALVLGPVHPPCSPTDPCRLCRDLEVSAQARCTRPTVGAGETSGVLSRTQASESESRGRGSNVPRGAVTRTGV